jgi:hypothetical protein
VKVGRAKIIVGFALGVAGCSAIVDFSGLAGDSACDGGQCAADAANPLDASGAVDAMGASDGSSASSDGASSDATRSDATASDGGATDAMAGSISYVTSASKRIGIYEDAATAPITSLTVTLGGFDLLRDVGVQAHRHL